MGFIGFEEDYNAYKKSDEYKEKEAAKKRDVNMIAYEDMDPISDEDLSILETAINRHDALEIFMQSDPSFYDSYYNADDEDMKKDDPLLQEARNIRRIYKNIPDYRYALYIRELYVDQLIEKYGGEERYGIFLRGGKIKEWIPPNPVLSKTAPGYDLYKQGYIDTEINDWDPDAVEEISNEFAEAIDVDNMRVVGDVETRHNVLLYADSVGDTTKKKGRVRVGGTNTRINGVDTNDLEQLQQMFRSWYQEDSKKTTEKKEDNNFFQNTPEKIRERFYEESPTGVFIDDETFERIMNGEHIPDDIDMDEMVIDPKTNLPMTRGELKKREFIRKMESLGYHDVKLMRRYSVGSEYELRLLEKKRNRHKLSKEKAAGLMDDLLGGDVHTISSIDRLSDVLFDD